MPVVGGWPDGPFLRGVTEMAFYSSMPLCGVRGELAQLAPMTFVTKASVIMSSGVNLTSYQCMHSFFHSCAI